VSAELDRKLSLEEGSRLHYLEARIKPRLVAFFEVGEALLEIRDRRLYRQGFTTFEDYCRTRWGFGDRYARNLIAGAEVRSIVPVENEGQARELAPVKDDPDLVREIHGKAQEKANALDEKLTAKLIRETKAEVLDLPEIPVAEQFYRAVTVLRNLVAGHAGELTDEERVRIGDDLATLTGRLTHLRLFEPELARRGEPGS
jgi:hypothetical protein